MAASGGRCGRSASRRGHGIMGAELRGSRSIARIARIGRTPSRIDRNAQHHQAVRGTPTDDCLGQRHGADRPCRAAMGCRACRRKGQEVLPEGGLFPCERGRNHSVTDTMRGCGLSDEKSDLRISYRSFRGGSPCACTHLGTVIRSPALKGVRLTCPLQKRRRHLTARSFWGLGLRPPHWIAQFQLSNNGSSTGPRTTFA